MTDPTAFRVPKRQAPATVTLVNGQTARGRFFLSESAETHAGPERVDELLNAEGRFVPFQVDSTTGADRVVLFAKSHILMVHVADSELELVHDSVYQIARREPATVLLTNGERITGEVHIAGVSGHARISEQAFIYIERQDQTVIVNFDHVIELVPLDTTEEASHG